MVLSGTLISCAFLTKTEHTSLCAEFSATFWEEHAKGGCYFTLSPSDVPGDSVVAGALPLAMVFFGFGWVECMRVDCGLVSLGG